MMIFRFNNFNKNFNFLKRSASLSKKWAGVGGNALGNRLRRVLAKAGLAEAFFDLIFGSFHQGKELSHRGYERTIVNCSTDLKIWLYLPTIASFLAMTRW